ncbi:MAG: flagellar biosynthesis regulator FlaF [Thiobacillaceae bacterium]
MNPSPHLSALIHPMLPVDAERLHGAAALLMACMSNWRAPDCEARLALAMEANHAVWHDVQDALAMDHLDLPLEVRQNLLILSVYADGKLSEFAEQPGQDKLGPLIALTRNLAASLKNWPVAA